MPISRKPYAIERILAAATYLTTGLVGFVWFIIAALAKKTITPFLMYHIMQSIFVSFAFFILSILMRLIFSIPFLAIFPYYINYPIPIFFGLSILQVFTTTIILYLAITSFLGYYSYLPWVSNIINDNVRR